MGQRSVWCFLLTISAIVSLASVLVMVSRFEDGPVLLLSDGQWFPLVGNINYFRAIADLCHIFALLILLYRVAIKRNSLGISVKTQDLYLIVFVTRYWDIFTTFYSWYNTIFKIVFVLVTLITRLATTRCTPYLKNSSILKHQDAFPHWKWLVLPALFTAFICWHLNLTAPAGAPRPANLEEKFFNIDSIQELSWGFSIILEPLAIVPQFAMLSWHSNTYWYAEIETLLGRYVFYLGIYRTLYIANWIYRAHHEIYYRHIWLVYIAGIFQTLLYLDFAYAYILSKVTGYQPALSPIRFLRQLARFGMEDENITLRARAAAFQISNNSSIFPGKASPVPSHRYDRKGLLSPVSEEFYTDYDSEVPYDSIEDPPNLQDYISQNKAHRFIPSSHDTVISSIAV